MVPHPDRSSLPKPRFSSSIFESSNAFFRGRCLPSTRDMEDARPGRPLQKHATGGAVIQPDDDSGYGGSSHGSLQSSDGLDRKLDAEDPETASAASPTPSPPSAAESDRSQLAQPPDPDSTQLRPISKPIDETTARRADDVIERMSGLLEEYMAKHKRKTIPIAIRIAMLGTTQEDAKACLVVFCDDKKGTHDRVRRFLRKPRAIELYRPQEAALPSFDVHVVGPPPRKRAGLAVDIPYSNLLDSPETTLCGMPVYFVQEDGSTNVATVGGLLEVEFPSGKVQLYGLTTAHGIMDLDDTDGDDASLSDESSDFDDSSSDSTTTSHGRYVPPAKVDWGPWLDSLPQETKLPSFRPPQGTVREPVVLSTLVNEGDGVFRDWALFPFPSVTISPKPNMLHVRGKDPMPLKVPTTLGNPSGSRSVMIITGSSGPTSATLSPCLGRIRLTPGTVFVRAYTVEPLDTSAICQGDSGSWVVDSVTFEVYGHLVATDFLMGSYVIPLLDIFDDIKTCLPGVLIQFPTPTPSLPLDNLAQSLSARHSWIQEYAKDSLEIEERQALPATLSSTSAAETTASDSSERPASSASSSKPKSKKLLKKSPVSFDQKSHWLRSRNEETSSQDLGLLTQKNQDVDLGTNQTSKLENDDQQGSSAKHPPIGATAGLKWSQEVSKAKQLGTSTDPTERSILSRIFSRRY